MKNITKRISNILMVMIIFLTSITSIFATEPTERAFVSPELGNITAATESALITTANGHSLSITSALAYIYADTHSNGSFQFSGSQLIQSGACNTVNGISKNTAYSKIDFENRTESFSLPNYIQSINNSIGDSFTPITNSNITTSPISKNVKSEDKLSIKANSLIASNYILAKNDINITTSSMHTSVDKPVFIISEQGNINITGSYADINGVIYAPNGTVTVNSSSFNLNGKIIAKNIVFQTTSISIKNNQNYFKKNISFEPTLELVSYNKDNLLFKLDNPNSNLKFFLQSRFMELQLEVGDEFTSSNLTVKCPETTGIYNYAAVASVDENNAVNSNMITIAVTDKGVFPIGKDSDDDYLDDATETKFGTDKLNSDTDKDGLIDGLEYYYYGSDPKKADTDGDGLTDFQEIAYTYTSPIKVDTDDNGITDPNEDNDNDGLSNIEEFKYNGNPSIADTDFDGLNDNEEVKLNTKLDNSDSDEDKLPDAIELEVKTNPLNPDTNGNGVLDGDEIYNVTRTANSYDVDSRVIPTVAISLEGNQISSIQISKIDEVKVRFDAQGKLWHVTLNSHPGMMDSDFDGYDDNIDENPLNWDISDRDLAICSQVAYSYDLTAGLRLDKMSADALNRTDEGFYGTASASELKGWKVFDYLAADSNNLKDGFSYTVFKRDSKYILTFRGTDGLTDWISNVIYLFADDINGRFASTIAEYVSTITDDNNLYITGHSRGGYLAQRAFSQLSKVNKESSVNQLAYFNGMGIVLKKNGDTAKEFFGNLYKVRDRVKTLKINNDIVSGIGEHVSTHKEYPVSSTAIKNVKQGLLREQEHAMCNFTYHLMPERFYKQGA